MRSLRGQKRGAAIIVVAATLLTFAGRAAADDADIDARPLFAAAKEAVADGRLTQTKVQGFTLGKAAFTEAPEEGGALIGFDLGVGKFMNIESIYALRAVFTTPGGDVTTKDHGLFRDKPLPRNKVLKTKVLRTVRLRAMPGYAVGGVTVRSGLNINGLSVTFMRINGARLDPNHSYESDWVGDRTGGGETYLGGDGAPAVGVAGNQDEEKVSALGLYFMKEPAAAVVAPAVVAPPAVVEPPPVVEPPAVVARPAARPQVEQPVEQPDDPPPAPAEADPPAAPAPPAAPPAAAPRAAAAPAPAKQSLASDVIAYVLPMGAFLAVAGTLLLALLVFSLSRKAQPDARNVKKPSVGPPRQRPAPFAPSTALCERPAPRRVNRPGAADEVLVLQPGDYEIVDEVLELGPDDFDPIPEAQPAPREAGRKVEAAAHDWPRLEL